MIIPLVCSFKRKTGGQYFKVRCEDPRLEVADNALYQSFVEKDYDTFKAL
jgi:hypothetical protein